MNALLAFDAAARHRNFTRAAEELSVSQPSVTRHISNLENWIGAPLFSRRGSLVDLTPEGRALSEIATATFDRMELSIREINRQNEAELVIGASFGVAHLWVMPRISAMRRASGKNINLVTSDHYKTFDDYSVDFSIRFGNGNFGNLCADLLFEERCHIIAAPAFLKTHAHFDPARLGETIDPKLLLDHGDPNGIGWMDWEMWHALTGTTFPGRSALTKVESYPTMLDMVFAGEGISIGTMGIEDELVASGKLVRLGKAVQRDGYGYYLVYRPDRQGNRAFEKVRALLLRRV